MKLFKKIHWLIYPVLLVLFLFIYDQFFDPENFILKVGICGVLAFILSPRKKKLFKLKQEKLNKSLGYFLRSQLL